ncbi:MAG: MFS transporter [Granulosicoccus sp.]
MLTSKLSDEWRFSLFYAALFGSFGAIAPFAALWLSHAGIPAREIGIIVAAPSIVMLLTTLKLGKWADGLANRRLAIVIGNWVVLLINLLLFVYTNTWVVLVVWIIAGISMYAIVPITDAAALSLTQRRGSDFARIRVFGSIGFIVAITLAGYIYEYAGIGSFLVVLLFFNIARLFYAYQLPSIQSVSGDNARKDTGKGESLYQTGILLTLAGSALINASHAMVNTFGILHWTQQGLSESMASMAIGIGVVAEVFLMWRFKSLTRRVSARHCLLFASLCAVLRWSVLASDPTVSVLFLVQILHGVTFGLMYLATANFIARRVAESAAARGQSLSAIISTGCMAVANFIAGWLFDLWRGDVYWIMAASCVVAAVALLASYRFVLKD